MFIVTLTNKATHEESIFATFTDGEKASKMCEEWGWTYDDGKQSYWMNYEEVAEGIFEFLEDAVPGRFVELESAIDAIQLAYKSGLITLEQRITLLRLC